MNALADGWRKSADRRAIFVEAYGTMTSNMYEAVDNDEFHDNQWVRRLLDRFAEYYFEGVAMYDSTGTCCQAWQIAHDSALRSDLHTLQHLFLGINAHINYDLALALVDVLEDWRDMSEAQRELRRADHEMVNLMIERIVDRVQDEVVGARAPEMATVDRLMGRVDEWFFSQLIAGWRDDVWDAATQILQADQSDRVRCISDLEHRAVETARLVIRF